jgi:oxygen-independent coproporphyrinogen-3 oxidase
MATELTLPELPPLSLYVHLPWCVRKCPYCDFNSHTAGENAPRERYLAALLQDIEAESKRASGRELVSVFLGGGTPSLFSPSQIDRLLAQVAATFTLANDAEITMEANPGTVECGDPAGYRSAGVNRLSIGAQSFSGESLQLLGRIHSVADIERSVTEARHSGFDNINVDLMYALPGQSVSAAMHDIEQAARLEANHISWYQLTLEPNTVFYARPPAGMPDDEQGFEIQNQGQARLAELGFEQYEVSAYVRDARPSVHNLNYWSFGDYLAVGAGAHAKISDQAGVWRYAKAANPQQYMAAIEAGGTGAKLVPVTAQARLFEFMLNASRLKRAFSAVQFASRTGLAAEVLRERLRQPLERGLIEAAGSDSWRVTTLGERFLNDLQAEFLPE